MCARTLALSALVAIAAPVEAQVTVNFQQGTGGYAGYQDSQIRETLPGTVQTDNSTFNAANAGLIRVDGEDGGGVVYGLLRFNNIFGTGAGQIPPGATITAATLRFDLTEDAVPPVNFFSFHRMVMDWNDTNATWNFFGGNGVTLDGIEAVATADVRIGDGVNPIPIGTLDVNVLPSLQAWSGGFANRGWYFRPESTNPATDGILFRSAEDATATLRPLLSVTFSPVPEPGVLLLTGLGMGAFVAREYRRRRGKGRVPE